MYYIQYKLLIIYGTKLNCRHFLEYLASILFPWFSMIQSFLPVVAWKNKENPMENFPWFPKYDAEHQAVTILQFNEIS